VFDFFTGDRLNIEKFSARMKNPRSFFAAEKRNASSEREGGSPPDSGNAEEKLRVRLGLVFLFNSQ